MLNIIHHHHDDTYWTTDEVNDLSFIETPQATNTHTPVPHYAFAHELERLFGDRIVEKQYALTNNDHRLFGIFRLGETLFDKALANTVIFRNSHDKSISAFVGGGTYTFICTNLAASATFNIRVKHTGNPWERIRAALPDLLFNLGVEYQSQAERLTHARSVTISRTYGDALIVEAARRSIIPKSAILDVSNEWNNPSFDYDGAGNDSLFTWRECFTATALRPTTPTAFMRNTTQTIALGELIEGVYEVIS